jgi:hypothetical protein
MRLQSAFYKTNNGVRVQAAIEDANIHALKFVGAAQVVRLLLLDIQIDRHGIYMLRQDLLHRVKQAMENGNFLQLPTHPTVRINPDTLLNTMRQHPNTKTFISDQLTFDQTGYNNSIVNLRIATHAELVNSVISGWAFGVL